MNDKIDEIIKEYQRYIASMKNYLHMYNDPIMLERQTTKLELYQRFIYTLESLKS